MRGTTVRCTPPRSSASHFCVGPIRHTITFPAHSTDRLPFLSHIFSPGRQGRSRRPERLLAEAATRRHHGRVQTHSSHIHCPICPLPACGPAPTETRKRCHGLLRPASQPTTTAACAAGTIISGLPKAGGRPATAETIGRSTLTEPVALLPIKLIHRHGSTSATHRFSLARQLSLTNLKPLVT